MSCLRTERLTKIYNERHVPVTAVNQVDLEIRRGEFAALVGPSGSGKTTLLNLIGGLDSPSSGKVYVESREISGLGETALAELRLHKIGFVFQEFNLIPVLSAIENVEYVMLLQEMGARERRERAEAVLAEVGLEGLGNRRPNELSGGQQQRVAVARAIVTQPAIVLADEPTANLDTETGTGLLETMHALNRDKQITFLLSTHDPLVMHSAHRVIRMRDGALVPPE